MAANTLVITKAYRDGIAFTEAIVDGIRSDLQSWGQDTVDNQNQMRLDVFGSSYAYDNDGLANNTNPMNVQQTITPTATITGLSLTGTSLTTGTGIDINTLDALSTGFGLRVRSNSADVGTRSLVDILNDNTAATGTTCINVQQDAAQRAVFLDQNADALALSIDSEATIANVIDVIAPTTTTGSVIDVGDADSLTTGRIATFISNSTSAGTRQLVQITNDNTAATGAQCLNLQQDANVATLRIDSTAAAQSVATVTVECTRAASSAYDFFLGVSGDGGDNEIRLRGDGEVSGDAAAYVTPAADYAEMFECVDKNGIEPGYFVTFDEKERKKVRIANSKDSYIAGIVSAKPAIVADTDWNRWAKKYLYDEFNRYLLDEKGHRI